MPVRIFDPRGRAIFLPQCLPPSPTLKLTNNIRLQKYRGRIESRLLHPAFVKRSAFSDLGPMVIITFPDEETQKRALGFLLGRFAGKVLKTGEHIVPEAALGALAEQAIAFTVKGKASYEQQVAALRSGASDSSGQKTLTR